MVVSVFLTKPRTKRFCARLTVDKLGEGEFKVTTKTGKPECTKDYFRGNKRASSPFSNSNCLCKSNS